MHSEQELLGRRGTSSASKGWTAHRRQGCRGSPALVPIVSGSHVVEKVPSPDEPVVLFRTERLRVRRLGARLD